MPLSLKCPSLSRILILSLSLVCITANLCERHFQEQNTLKVRIGGLLAEWDSRNVDYDDGIEALTKFL